ncbi:MAG: hypothetical protein NC340_02920 [Ruminococcus flavefaciens]|nr:hypothetical protein [Ruminococcus flavefaciens]MCM1229453.1 hypothetical protein [Ruminococcus flavefaciens]
MENYDDFLTAEDKFRLAIEKYLPEFLQRMADDTMQNPEFVQQTIEMMSIAEEAGIDLQQYILNYGKANGIE